MRVLAIDFWGTDGMQDICMRCQGDGHKVKWYFHRVAGKSDMIGRGLVERVDDYRPWLRWADLIILGDNTKYLAQIDAWRRANPDCAVVAATQASAALELDRNEGMRVLKKHGVEVLPGREFKRYDDAVAYVKKEMRRFASKPCGDEPDKSLTYCAKSPADMVYMLERWKRGRKHKGSFILQEFMPGVEMAVGGWLGPAGFMPGWCENWEFKKLMNGEKGVATGEMGTVLRVVEKSKLADMVLKPLEDYLVSTGHTGYVDVNCIIDDSGTPWPLEWTMRPGWPLFNIQQALIEGDHAEWLANLAHGRSVKQPFVLNRVATGVVLSIPDFPYSRITRKEVVGIPIYIANPRIMPSLSLCEVGMGEAPQEVAGKILTAPCLVTAGDYVLVAHGSGPTVQASRRAAYRVLDQVEIPNSPMWRTDIGLRLAKQLPLIQKHGFAKGLEF